jgi:hypothetical protein
MKNKDQQGRETINERIPKHNAATSNHRQRAQHDTKQKQV